MSDTILSGDMIAIRQNQVNCGPGRRMEVELGTDGRSMTLQQVLEQLQSNWALYSPEACLTLTGQEPLNQTAFCAALLRKAKQMGANTAVVTHGAARWEAYQAAAKLTDLFLFYLPVEPESRAMNILRRVSLELRRPAWVYLTVGPETDPAVFASGLLTLKADKCVNRKMELMWDGPEEDCEAGLRPYLELLKAGQTSE